MAAILVVIVWKYFGFHMMLFIAGLQGIDKALLDAAADRRRQPAGSASATSRCRCLCRRSGCRCSSPSIGSLQLFDMIMPLTKGGPADSTQTLVTFLYSFGIMRMRVGFGSAVGVVLFAICVIFAFTYKRLAFRDA